MNGLDFIEENLDAVLEVFMDDTSHEQMMARIRKGEVGYSVLSREAPIGFLLFEKVGTNLYLNALWANVRSTAADREAFIHHVGHLAIDLGCKRIVLDTKRDNLARRAESFGFKRYFRLILEL